MHTTSNMDFTLNYSDYDAGSHMSYRHGKLSPWFWEIVATRHVRAKFIEPDTGWKSERTAKMLRVKPSDGRSFRWLVSMGLRRLELDKEASYFGDRLLASAL